MATGMVSMVSYLFFGLREIQVKSLLVETAYTQIVCSLSPGKTDFQELSTDTQKTGANPHCGEL
jgi:hypothetical protein